MKPQWTERIRKGVLCGWKRTLDTAATGKITFETASALIVIQKIQYLNSKQWRCFPVAFQTILNAIQFCSLFF